MAIAQGDRRDAEHRQGARWDLGGGIATTAAFTKSLVSRIANG
jgi:hypothetical protein